MLTSKLGTERLYEDVRQALGAMSSYLDSESLRRQSRFFLQLTVVTICFMVGTITATFLGMNVLDFGRHDRSPKGSRGRARVHCRRACHDLYDHEVAASCRVPRYIVGRALASQGQGAGLPRHLAQGRALSLGRSGSKTRAGSCRASRRARRNRLVGRYQAAHAAREGMISPLQTGDGPSLPRLPHQGGRHERSQTA